MRLTNMTVRSLTKESDPLEMQTPDVAGRRDAYRERRKVLPLCHWS